jgi:circadian clock protein KaiB
MGREGGGTVTPTFRRALGRVYAHPHNGVGETVADYSFRLYVTGDTTLSQEAETNLRALCKDRLDGRHEIEIVDVLERPDVAEEELVIATPTVVRLAPPPRLRVIGDLSDRELAADAFGLPRPDDSRQGEALGER